MEITNIWYMISLTIFVIYLFHKIFIQRGYNNLPPSPAFALPIIGHLHLLKQPLHRTFHKLSQTHGPIFSLRLGVRLVVVVSSSDLVEECFTKRNDIILANRPLMMVDKYIAYNNRTMSGANYGEYWRSLRRVASQELLSNARLNALLHIRKDETRRLLLNLRSISSDGFTKVELRPRLSELSFNVMMRMIAGKRSLADGEELSKLINAAFELAGASNPQDFLPILWWIDYGGVTKRMVAIGERLDEFFQSLVEEHRREKRNTMIGHLLSLQQSQPELYSDLTIKCLTFSMLLAGTDTSSVTIEWAISLLLNHPHILEKVKEEVNAQVGLHRLINEDDLLNLPYLNSIVLETLRLFPPGPLLVPHESSEDCTIGEYNIPRGTMLLINAWAIQRDPCTWDKATDFEPERFVGKEVETRKFLPFGMGRRACPGTGLAHRMVGLALGSLIQCFEWEKVSSEEVELDEGIGLSMPKLKPLELKIKPREIMYEIVV